jgi:hypothetical protein
MKKGGNLALKGKVVDHEETQPRSEEASLMLCPKDIQFDYNQHMAFAIRSFWVDPVKAKETNYHRSKTSGHQRNDSSGQRVRTCYNCNDRFYFVAKCPYEKREDNSGKFIRKDKSNTPHKNPFGKKNSSNKKQSRIVLMKQEEYSSREASDEEETTTSGVRNCYHLHSLHITL